MPSPWVRPSAMSRPACAAERQIPTLDLSDLLCDDTSCRVMDGDLIVFADRHHIATQWAMAHTDVMQDFLERTLRRRPPRGDRGGFSRSRPADHRRPGWRRPASVVGQVR